MDNGVEGQPKASRRVRIANPEGMHLRAASLLIRVAKRFEARVKVSNHNGCADAKTTPLQLLALGAQPGEELAIEAIGPDAEEAVEAIAKLIEHHFEELPEGPER